MVGLPVPDKNSQMETNIIINRPGAAQGKYIIVCRHKPWRVTGPSCKNRSLQYPTYITFLDALHDAAVKDRPEQPRFVVVVDNLSFQEMINRTCCIDSTAHASDEVIRVLSTFLFHQLNLNFFADNRLQLSHHVWVRVGSHCKIGRAHV